ncbi:MAG: hypothetical protein GY737_24220 [Desulfobacteraceae bacterium]|nr:hypothetical protein [Desulfobacteraceae bacterium]
MRIITFFLLFTLSLSSYAEPQGKSLRPPKDLITKADTILDLIDSADFKSLINHIHPIKGLNFSPYARDLTKLFIINFPPKIISNFRKDKHLYLWGYYDGIGTPIELTPMEYYEQFIYDIDYKTKSEGIYISNKDLKTQYSLNAIYKTYPGSSLVQYNYKGTEATGFKDFKDLILIFTKIKNQWYLEGLAHSESTL